MILPQSGTGRFPCHRCSIHPHAMASASAGGAAMLIAGRLQHRVRARLAATEGLAISAPLFLLALVSLANAGDDKNPVIRREAVVGIEAVAELAREMSPRKKARLADMLGL